jgi:stearoyl-CoA desaturase (delta-9 desaturase)
MTERLKTIVHKFIILALVVVPLAGMVVAIRLLWDRAVDWQDIALLVGFYVPISMGITIGFHRYLTHRGFRANPVIKATLLILGSMAVEGSAISWAANHRKHHALADQEGDPHSPADGFFHAHVGWLFEGKAADQTVYARDLREDRLVMFISRTFPIWVALSLLIPFAIGGWTGLLWGGLVRIFLTHHVTWSVNSVCHTFGNRPFRTKDLSRNQWAVGLLALGEGWHNNHHAFPRSALHGLRWWQFDLSGLTIRLLERFRLIWNVQRVTPVDIQTRRTRKPVDIAA